jgi:PAS domain S-box-containing protein
MYSEATRRKALDRAIANNQPAMSGAIQLVQEEDEQQQKGFLIYLPVYKQLDPGSTTKKRRSLIKGTVYAVFRAGDLISNILGTRFTEIDVKVYDGTEPDSLALLFDKEPNYTLAEQKDNLKTSKIINVAGQPWLIKIGALPEFGYDTSFAPVLLIGGLIISILLSFVMASMADARQSAYLKQVITDNATAAIFILDKKGRCTFMNPAAELLTGYESQELDGQDWHQYLHYQYPDGSFFPKSESSIYKILNSRKSLYNHEDVFYKKSGESFYSSVNSQPLLVKGNLMGHLLELYDISAEKEAEEALHQKNQMLETLNTLGINLSAELELSRLLQRVVNASTQLISASNSSLFYFHSNNEVLEHYPENPAVGPFPIQVKDKLAEYVLDHSGILWSEDMEADPKLAHLRPAKIRSFLAVPIRLRSGKAVGVMFLGHPMPNVFTSASVEFIRGIAAQAGVAIENSHLFESLNRSNRELVSTNNDLDNFVYSASHDLKAPVLNIEGLVIALERSQSTNNPDRIQKIMSLIRESVERFKGTIQALAEVAETNRNIDDEFRAIDLTKKIELVLESISDMVKQSQAVIETDLNCEGLRFSPAYTISILQNLITNAIKYRHPERTPRIKISCRTESSFYVLEVADNGLGLSSESQSRMFTMFKRFHSHVEGSGVGLYLVRRILENNGGKIEVDSVEGEGSIFRVYFPKG